MSRRAYSAVRFGSILPVVLALSAAVAGAEAGARLWPITLDGKQGYINQDGRVVIAPRFSLAWVFSQGLASAWVGGSAGYISEAGKFVIPPRFQYARAFHGGLAEVEVADHWGFIDKTGEFVVKPEYEATHSFNEERGAFPAFGQMGLFR